MAVSVNWGSPFVGPYLRDPMISGPYLVRLIFGA